MRWRGIERDRQIAAKPEVLRALADAELQHRAALARIPAVELGDPVFERRAAQRRGERPPAEFGEVQPAVSDLIFRRVVELPGLRAFDLQRRGHPGFVVDLDQKVRPAALH
ncbi:MAG: hypothetical protein R3F11_22140 [Verrucomicrobiales bacterium]